MATNEPKIAPTDSDAEMASWSGVESEMKTHDQAMVKDYAEDVDNLLVFELIHFKAGLFSAVLTAFLVESYTMLQEDSSETNKQLLVRISTQLETFSPGANLMDPPNPPPLPSDKFTPTRAAIWINALWFLSLIFSLAAAFFGIRVRQWLREYLQWNAALAHPRDNVYIRQVRFEALETWKVLGSISIIPGLLELALVLFVSGIVIFLWTLDPTVAIVVTIAVTLFLSTAATLTVLPAFLKRCPYKSPTAWVCVLLFSWVTDVPGFYHRIKAKYTKAVQEGGRSKLSMLWRAWKNSALKLDQVQNWRGRDREGGYIATIVGQDQKGVTAVIGLETELFAAVRYSPQEYTISPRRHSWVHNERVPWAALRSISEVGCLSRALVWVIQSSQDSRIHQHAFHCCKSLPPQGTDRNKEISDVGLESSVEHLSRLYLLWRIWPAALGGLSHTASPMAITTTLLIRPVLQQFFHRQDYTEPSGPPIPMTYLIPNALNSVAIAHSHTETEVKVIARILSEGLQRTMMSPWPWVDAVPIFELISALLVLQKAFYGRLIDDCRDNIIQSFNSNNIEDYHVSGTRAALFHLVLSCCHRFAWRYKFDEGGLLVEHHNAGPSLLMTSFISSVRLDYRDPESGVLDNMRIFVGLANDRLEDAENYHDQLPMAELLNRMTNHVEQTREHRYANCGYIDDLPWLGDLVRGWASKHILGCMLRLRAILNGDPQPFCRLIHALHVSNKRSLLTGPIVENLPFLLRLANASQGIRDDYSVLWAWLEGNPGPGVEVPGHPGSAPGDFATISTAETQEEQSNRPMEPTETAAYGMVSGEISDERELQRPSAEVSGRSSSAAGYPAAANSTVMRERQPNQSAETIEGAVYVGIELDTFPPGVADPTVLPVESSDEPYM